MKPLQRRQRGLAPLEFALGVAVAGVLITLALNALGPLKWLGDEARRVTIASNQAAASSTHMLHCELAPPGRSVPADCAPCAPVPSLMPTPGTAASTFPPSRSCP